MPIPSVFPVFCVAGPRRNREHDELSILSAGDIFGRENFIADVIWQSRKSISSDGLLSVSSTHVLTYAKDKTAVNKADFKLALDIEGFDLQDELGKYKIEPLDAPNVRENLEYKELHELIMQNLGENITSKVSERNSMIFGLDKKI